MEGKFVQKMVASQNTTLKKKNHIGGVEMGKKWG